MRLWIVCFVVVAAVSVGGVDEESLKERRCIHPKPYPNLDLEWFGSVKQWYFPMLSRLEAFRYASDISERKVSDIPESVLKESCPYSDAKFNSHGFGFDTVGKYDITLGKDFVFTFKGQSKYAIGGTHVVTLTDNKSFAVGVTCWDDDEATFAVWSASSDPFSAEVKGQIDQHLDEQGSDPKFRAYMPCFQKSETKIDL